jgi:MerR family transcriptional regulator, heat shock protein HspR
VYSVHILIRIVSTFIIIVMSYIGKYSIYRAQSSPRVYSMAIASRLCGMHPQTLRKYERAGLVSPTRRGPVRFYSDADIGRLLLIRSLIEDCGLNISGVAMALRVREILLRVRRDLASGVSEKSMARMLTILGELQNELEGESGRIEPKRKYSRVRMRAMLRKKFKQVGIDGGPVMAREPIGAAGIPVSE